VAYKSDQKPENLHNSNSWSDGSQIGQKLHHFLYNLERKKNTKEINCNAVLEKAVWKMEENHQAYREKLLVIKQNCSIRAFLYWPSLHNTIEST